MMNTTLPLEGPNPAIHPDCVLDRPTAGTAIHIALFCALVGYVYKARPNHWRTFANAAINMVLAIHTRFGRVFLWRLAFVFRWI